MNDETLSRVGRASTRLGIRAVAEALQPRDNVRVTLTHHVDPEHEENFRRVVGWVATERQPIDPSELLSAWAEPKAGFTGRRIAFTFDDGLLSSYAAAQNVLNPLGIKAIFFVPTMIFSLRSDQAMRDFFTERVYRDDRGSLPRSQYVVMTEAHVRELVEQGHHVLPHTHSHVSLASIRDETAAEREVRAPKKLLEDLLQSRISAFAFPFGTERDVDAYGYAAARQEFEVTFTGLRGVNTQRTDPHTLYRDCVHPHYSLRYSKDLLGGALDPIYAMKMRRLRRRVARDE